MAATRKLPTQTTPELTRLIQHRSPSNASAADSAPQVRLEQIESDFTAHKHVLWRELRTRSQHWVIDQRLLSPEMAIQHSDALCYTDLVAGYYLDSTFPALAAITDFSIWFFHWDDYHQICCSRGWDDQWHDLMRTLRATLTAPDQYLRHSQPLVAALSDCLIRFFGRTSDEWIIRFTTHMQEIFDGYDQEYHNSLDTIILTIDEYIPHRRLTFGHQVWIDLMEFSARHELPAAVRDSDPYRRAALASQDFSAWCNDLYSLPKELAAGETHNLGIVLMHHHGLSADQATTELRHRINNRITEFLRAEQDLMTLQTQLAPIVSDTLGACLFNMRQWFPAVYWFHCESSRYRLNEPNSPGHLNGPT